MAGSSSGRGVGRIGAFAAIKPQVRRTRRVHPRGCLKLGSSRKNLVDHVAVHIGKATVNAIVPECQPLVIDAQKAKDGGMDVENLGWVFPIRRLVTPIVTRSEA